MAQLDDFSKIIHNGNEIGKVLHQGKTIWSDVYLARDSDFVKVDGHWVYKGAELEVEIPTHINGELVTSTNSMFRADSTYQATPVTKVVLKHSNVTDMYSMFSDSSVTTLDLSSFDTSNVTDMGYMFVRSSATTLDLSSFNTSNVTDMSFMFNNSSATIGYARTQADADKFNESSYKPEELNFVVKP